jgi:hypothetical protein
MLGVEHLVQQASCASAGKLDMALSRLGSGPRDRHAPLVMADAPA